MMIFLLKLLKDYLNIYIMFRICPEWISILTGYPSMYYLWSIYQQRSSPSYELPKMKRPVALISPSLLYVDENDV